MHEAAYTEMARLQEQHWWYRGRRHIIATAIRGLGLKPRAHILEAGCGPGGNLAMLSDLGTVSAFEPHDGARDFANSLGCADVQFGTLPDGIPFPPTFDLVCAFDVIEHIEDDRSALRALAAHCGPGGRVIMTVPAQPWLWSEHDERNRHYRRYTSASLRRLVADSGLVVERLTSFNSFLFPVVAGVRLIQKALGMGTKAEDNMPSPMTNRILEKIFASEAAIVSGSGFPIGISLLAVLRPAGGAR